MKILFQGDSITDGNRYKEPERRHDLNHQIGTATHLLSAVCSARNIRMPD